MTAAEPNLFEPRGYSLSDSMRTYLDVLTRRAAGTIIFRTGSGRFLRDLLIHWPTLDDWENEALELCRRIVGAAYPLAAALYAQAVEMTITISRTEIAPPQQITTMSTYVIFDSTRGSERQCFLSPRLPAPPVADLTAGAGVVVMCRPLNYRYHTITDDRKRGRGAGCIFEVTERMIEELYAEPPFVPREKALADTLKTKIAALPKTLARSEQTRDANLAQPSRHLTPSPPIIAMLTSISGLPSPVRALERRLMTHVTDKSLSPDFRLHLRRAAQKLRVAFPHVTLEEAARTETVPPVLKPSAVHISAPYAAPPIDACLHAQAEAELSLQPLPAFLRHAAPSIQPVPAFAFPPLPISSRPTPWIQRTAQTAQQSARLRERPHLPVRETKTSCRQPAPEPQSTEAEERPAPPPEARPQQKQQPQPPSDQTASDAETSRRAEPPRPQAEPGPAPTPKSKTKANIETRPARPDIRQSGQPEERHGGPYESKPQSLDHKFGQDSRPANFYDRLRFWRAPECAAQPKAVQSGRPATTVAVPAPAPQTVPHVSLRALPLHAHFPTPMPVPFPDSAGPTRKR